MFLSDPVAAIPLLANASVADVDFAIAELSRPDLRPTEAHVLTRAYALGVRYERDHDPATLASALADFAACRLDNPHRDMVARSLVLRQLQAALLGHEVDLAAVRATIDDAGDDPAVPNTVDVLHALVDCAAALIDDPGYDRAAALRRLDEVEGDEVKGVVPADSQYGRLLPTMRMALAVKRGQDGNYADAQAAAGYARAMLERGDLDPRQRLMTEAMIAASDGMAASQHGDMGRTAEALLKMTEVVDALPPDDPATAAMRNLVGGAKGIFDGQPTGTAREPGLSAGERAFRLYLSAVAVLAPAIEKQDAAALARGVGLLRQAVEVAPADYPHRAMLLGTLGRMLCARYQLGGGRPALDEAVRRLEAARQAAAHPGHPLWATTAMALGFAYRLAGRRAEGRDWGLKALRGHAWSVLLQAGTADAAAAARHAVDDAVQVARWCVADGDHAGAVAALDSGRCLMLYAATVSMDIPTRLRGVGRDDLLAGWERDAEDADLRQEVLTALTGEPVSAASVPDVLDPPDLDEIRHALSILDADALVYLVPGDDEGLGGAVLVPPGDRPYHLPLPLLTSAAGTVDQHVRLLAARDAGEVDGCDGSDADDQRWRDTLDRLCSWAWTAAVGPLLAELRRWRLDRPPRLILVPMGSLASVPWHAARDGRGDRGLQHAIFSYAPSARLLCQNARRPDVAVDDGGLVVGDPTRDLPDARSEALAVRSAFYPAAELLGDAGDPAPATAAAVRDWLRRTDGSRSLLHLACHGAVREGIDGSYLVLASGERLSARDILETRRTGAIGLVALAACTTNVPSGAYDEAFSLSTAFLAAGARTVFGSLWPVPSGATSLLMFMAHHYLREEKLPPAEALNQAQRWVLDPDRTVPSTMPPGLAARVPALDADDVAAWAGFTHQGR